MTTALTTIQRTAPKSGVSRFSRFPLRLGAALAGLGERIAAWSAPYYEQGLGDLAALPDDQRLDAALRWHARTGRVL